LFFLKKPKPGKAPRKDNGEEASRFRSILSGDAASGQGRIKQRKAVRFPNSLSFLLKNHFQLFL
jgi:hypothetical protein